MKRLILCVMSLLTGSLVWADTLFVNRFEFSRATANSTTIDFSDVPDNLNHYIDEVSPFAFEGVVFTSDQPLRIYTSGRSVRDYPNYAVPVLEVVNGSNSQRHEDLIINIPSSAATAFGLQVGSGRFGRARCGPPVCAHDKPQPGSCETFEDLHQG
jgi:hypothetical protein